jgi:hypothetical protein
VSETTVGEPLPNGKKPQIDLTGAEWLSSQDGNGDVQIAFVGGYIAMRDGRHPDGPALILTPAEWRAFVLGARDGEFDLDRHQPPAEDGASAESAE